MKLIERALIFLLVDLRCRHLLSAWQLEAFPSLAPVGVFLCQLFPQESRTFLSNQPLS
jgi:hypothetical protein